MFGHDKNAKGSIKGQTKKRRGHHDLSECKIPLKYKERTAAKKLRFLCFHDTIDAYLSLLLYAITMKKLITPMMPEITHLADPTGCYGPRATSKVGPEYQSDLPPYIH